MKKLSTALFVALLTGCSSTPDVSPETLAIAKAPLVCVGDEQCGLYWERRKNRNNYEKH